MSQRCSLINERFDATGYKDAASLFLPPQTDLCEIVSPWPYSISRNFATAYVSPLARGQRLVKYLKEVSNKYIALYPPACQIIDLLVKRASRGVTPTQASLILLLLGKRGCLGFDALPADVFNFPEIFAWDYGIQTEEYFLGCNISIAKHEKPITFIFVLQRKSLVPRDHWNDKGGSMNSVLVIQYMITIPHENKIIRNTFTVDGAWNVGADEVHPFYISAGDAFGIKSIRNDDFLFPLQVWCVDPEKDVSVKLQIMAMKPVNKKVESVLSEGVGSRFFAWPRVDVVSGYVTYEKSENAVQTGTGWLNRQFGTPGVDCNIPKSIFTRAINNIKGRFRVTPRFNASNWFVIHLQDGTEVGGDLLPAPEPIRKGLGPFPLTRLYYIDEQNNQSILKGTLSFGRYVQSPVSRAWYPVDWTVNVPKLKLSFNLTQTVDHAFNHTIDGTEYFDAGAIVTGSENGTGLMKTRNYIPDETYLKNRLKLLGFTNTEELAPHFQSKKTPLGTFVASCILVFIVPILIVLFAITLGLVILKR